MEWGFWRLSMWFQSFPMHHPASLQVYSFVKLARPLEGAFPSSAWLLYYLCWLSCCAWLQSVLGFILPHLPMICLNVMVDCASLEGCLGSPRVETHIVRTQNDKVLQKVAHWLTDWTFSKAAGVVTGMTQQFGFQSHVCLWGQDCSLTKMIPACQARGEEDILSLRQSQIKTFLYSTFYK